MKNVFLKYCLFFCFILFIPSCVEIVSYIEGRVYETENPKECCIKIVQCKMRKTQVKEMLTPLPKTMVKIGNQYGVTNENGNFLVFYNITCLFPFPCMFLFFRTLPLEVSKSGYVPICENIKIPSSDEVVIITLLKKK